MCSNGQYCTQQSGTRILGVAQHNCKQCKKPVHVGPCANGEETTCFTCDLPTVAIAAAIAAATTAATVTATASHITTVCHNLANGTHTDNVVCAARTPCSSSKSRCLGVWFKKENGNGKANMQYKKLKFFIGKRLRKVADEIENHDDIISLFGDAVKGKSAIYQRFSLGTFVDDYSDSFKITTENDAVIVYSNECTGESRSETSTRCKPCEDMTHKLKMRIHRSLPVGMIESTQQMDETVIHPRTKRTVLYNHPKTAEAKMNIDFNKIRSRDKIIARLKYKDSIEKEYVKCNNKKQSRAIYKCFKEANNNISEQLSEMEDEVERIETKQLWEIAFERMQEVVKKKGNTRNLKFHPALLNFALMILAKSSKSVYDEIQPVFKLPTYSRLMQIQRETTGSQLETDSPYGLIPENMDFIGKLFNKRGFNRKGFRHRRTVAISFDSMYTKRGIQWDAHGNMTGVDPHLYFNVITNKFKTMVR